MLQASESHGKYSQWEEWRIDDDRPELRVLVETRSRREASWQLLCKNLLGIPSGVMCPNTQHYVSAYIIERSISEIQDAPGSTNFLM
jgi:hypothetical protein